jgi:hypothetical protein
VIERFYRNYDSIRYVGDILVLRVRTAPTRAQLGELNERFGHLVAAGRIDRVDPFRIEKRDDDKLHLERIAFRSTKSGFGDLVAMIHAINEWGEEG